MGLSIRVTAVIPHEGESYQSHLKVKEACLRAGVPIPVETEVFLSPADAPESDGYEEVTELGLEHSLKYGKHADAMRGEVMYGGGACIDLQKLPEGTRYIRVQASS